MLKNYLKMILRTARRYRALTAINIAGLAVGMACCLLILLYVQDELSFDRFHQNADRIYRLIEYIESDDVGERSSSMPFPAGPTLQADFPHLVEASVRFFNFQAPVLSLEYQEAGRAFNERRLFFADASVFQVFSFPLVQGDPQQALVAPYSIVLTEGLAAKYFEAENPVGKRLRFQGDVDLLVTGVMADTPHNAHFQIDALISFETARAIYAAQGRDPMRGWYWNPCWTYLLLRDEAAAGELAAQFPSFVDKYYPRIIRDDVTMHLQPLTKIHLTSHLDYEIEANGRESNIYIFAAIALFILLIAGINFMNLATARATNRAREVGLRKTFGGQRHQLVRQFLLEACLITVVAFVLAVAVVELLLPLFNQLTAKSIAHGFWQQPLFLLTLLLMAGLIGFGAGIYPAFVLSAFDPIDALKKEHLRPHGFDFRKLLVILQFAISFVMLVGTAVAIRQLSFLQQDETGFQREHIVMLPVLRSAMGANYEVFRDEALRLPGIEAITAVEEVVGAKFQSGSYRFEGMPEPKLFNRLNVRHDFTQTFAIPIVAGRDYSRQVETDDTLALVVNESLVRHLGWTSSEAAVGKFVDLGRPAQIVGVVRDFNFASKHQPIAPLVLDLNTNPGAFELFIKYVAVRLNPQQVRPALDHLRTVWQTLIPDRPFDYFFLDQNLQQLYDAESRLTRVAIIFSGLAIAVACLGLFGLASFTAEQRRREIGIRKVLGSTTGQIVLLLSKEFTRLVLIACAIALPVAWLLIHTWLRNFAYRIEVGAEVFALAALLSLLVAWLTVSFQAIRAGLANPVEALRQE